MEQNNVKLGIFNGIFAYLIWGLLPIYWKSLYSYSADVVFSHRIIWSFVFMMLLILFTKQLKPFLHETKRIFKNKKLTILMLIIAFIISANWLIFIWAVQAGYVLQASLGYYINPLVNIFLGVIILKERLSRAQTISCVLAFIGVLFLTISYGVFPWISLSLAFSFGLYGLLKKIADIHSMYSLAIETTIILPFILFYLIYIYDVNLAMKSELVSQNLLLIFAGVATAVPLLLFGSSVRHLTYSTVGFLQYIAPTLMLVIGVFLYNETFTIYHFVTFLFIWIALIIYMGSTFKLRKKQLMR